MAYSEYSSQIFINHFQLGSSKYVKKVRRFHSKGTELRGKQSEFGKSPDNMILTISYGPYAMDNIRFFIFASNVAAKFFSSLFCVLVNLGNYEHQKIFRKRPL